MKLVFMRNRSLLAYSILFVLVLSLVFPYPVKAASLSDLEKPPQEVAAQNEKILVYYSGPDGAVRTAISLASEFEITDQIGNAQIIVINGAINNPDEVSIQFNRGAGVVIILGENTTSESLYSALGIALDLQKSDNAVSLISAAGFEDPLYDEILWNSAPQVRNRYQISSPASNLVPLITSYEDGAPILARLEKGNNQAFILSAFLNGENTQFQEWAYFNYLIYYLTLNSLGKHPVSFAEYPASPVPHQAERSVLIITMSGLLLLATSIFIFVRRYSKVHPELLDALVIDRKEFQARQASTEWEAVGFHRPLGGFLLAFMLGLVLFIPIIIYQNLILPVYILPSAQALGIWGRVVQFFNFLWLLLDMGTSAAFIKFFSQHRVHDPRKAILFGQVFIWWQAISGAIQVAMVIILAGTFLPKSVYALYTWSVITHTLIQIPGFYQVMRHGLMSWQRFDYAQMLDIGLALVFPMLTQPLIVSLMVAYGKSNPIFGGSMGGLIGLGLAAYAAEGLTFILGFWLYRRLGYNAKLLFMAHFDWQTVKTALRFGMFEMLGSVAWATGQAVEILVTQTRLVNYTEIWGNWVLAQNFVYAFNVMQTLFENVMSSTSEAISNTYKALSQYYSAMAYKWGGMISAFIGAVLLAVADRFILGASGPEFVRAAAYAVPLTVWGAIQYPSWVGDSVQLASNRPYIKSAMVAGEQFIRIVLIWVLLERFQVNALIIAYFIGLLAKGILAYFINNRLCFPQRFFIWQSLIAPGLAGTTHYLLLRWVTGLIWQGDEITSVLIFLIGILISYPIYAFLYGFFGGWDEQTLAELGQGADLSNFMRPFARLFWRSTSFGASLSPLHNRFPITIREKAMQEAASLTRKRVNL